MKVGKMVALDTNTWKPVDTAQVAYHDHFNADTYSVKFADKGTQGKSATIQIGQINGLTEPSKWVPGQPSPKIGYIEYHPGANDLVKLYTYDRGRRLDPDVAKTFADVLYNYAPHTLKADELSALQKNGVLRDKGPNAGFTPLIAKTEDLNGRRVLVVEGTWKPENLHVRTVYVDADIKKDGSVIQELSYQAPASIYHQYLTQARKAIQSVTWK
jgi:hypothetical protein